MIIILGSFAVYIIKSNKCVISSKNVGTYRLWDHESSWNVYVSGYLLSPWPLAPHMTGCVDGSLSCHCICPESGWSTDRLVSSMFWNNTLKYHIRSHISHICTGLNICVVAILYSLRLCFPQPTLTSLDFYDLKNIF